VSRFCASTPVIFLLSYQTRLAALTKGQAEHGPDESVSTIKPLNPHIRCEQVQREFVLLRWELIDRTRDDQARDERSYDMDSPSHGITTIRLVNSLPTYFSPEDQYAESCLLKQSSGFYHAPRLSFRLPSSVMPDRRPHTVNREQKVCFRLSRVEKVRARLAWQTLRSFLIHGIQVAKVFLGSASALQGVLRLACLVEKGP
jgi:hypothetical protein